MIRILTLAGALAGAVALSQFPEYSQQYLQRLAGAVDELRNVVVTFDATAAASGLTREEALADLSASEFQSDLQRTLAAQIRRYEDLAQDYLALRQSDPVDRLIQVFRFTDPDLARRTFADFRPAVPVTQDGLLFAGIGFAGGWAVLAALVAGLGRLFRRPPKRPAPARQRRRVPQDVLLLERRHHRDVRVTRGPGPRLPGATRPQPSHER